MLSHSRHSEDGGSMALQNVCIPPHLYTSVITQKFMILLLIIYNICINEFKFILQCIGYRLSKPKISYQIMN